MKKTMLCTFGLLLAACHDEPTMTFGLEFRVAGSETGALTSQFCSPPGEYGGLMHGSSIDDWEIDEPPPHPDMISAPPSRHMHNCADMNLIPATTPVSKALRTVTLAQQRAKSQCR